jgi:hypothetical protein
VYVFLSGAEMQPERVRSAWPEARFVARGRLDSSPVEEPDEIWGIIVEIPQTAIEGDERQAVSDDGRPFAVVALPPDDGDGAAVLAAARYWELSPAYVRRLVRALGAPGEDPVDG